MIMVTMVVIVRSAQKTSVKSRTRSLAESGGMIEFEAGSIWRSNGAGNSEHPAIDNTYIVFVDQNHVRVYNHTTCCNGEYVRIQESDKPKILKFFDEVGEKDHGPK